MQLSAEEYNTITNSHFLLVKAEAVAKIWAELDALTDGYLSTINQNNIDLGEINRPAKISKGENYLGLPYLVLDYPAAFEKEDILAFRTMFWWGNLFSVTLHLQGIYKDKFQQSVLQNIYQSDKKGLYICHAETPWHYHFENDNYIPAEDLTQAEISNLLTQKNFIKLSYKLPLSNHHNLAAFMGQHFQKLALLLKTDTDI